MTPSGKSHLRLTEHRLEIAENGITHSLLQSRAGTRPRRGELLEDPAKDHEGDLPVVSRFSARERGHLALEASRNEVHEDLPQDLLFLAGGSRERRINHEGVKLRMPPIETYANIEQLLDGFGEAQDACGVDCALRFGHFACVKCRQRAGDSFFIGEKLVERCRRYPRFLGNGVSGCLVIAQTAKDRGRGAEEIQPALLAARVTPAVGIEDGHRTIFAEEKQYKQKLASFLIYKYLLA